MATRAESWRTSISENDSRYLGSSTCQITRSRAYFHKHKIEAEHPPCSARREPSRSIPHRWGSRLRGPAPPAGPFPFSGAPCRRSRPARTVRVTPTSGAAFFDLDRTLLAGASRRGVLRGDARGRARQSRSIPGERLLSTGCSTRSARRCRRWRSPARRSTLAKGRSQAAVAGRRPRRPPSALVGDGAAVRRAGCSTSTAPPAARSCWPPPRRTTSSSRSPTALGLDDVVATRYGVDADGTLRRHARRPVRVVGRQARRRRASGPRSTASTSPRATPTPTASTTRRCCRRSATRSWSTPTRGWCSSPSARRWPIAAPRRARRACRRSRVARHRAPAAGDAASPGPQLIPYARFDIDGVEHIPTDGPAILVGNHRSYFDPLAMAMAIAKRGRTGALPRQEGGVRRPDRRPAGHGDGRHPRRPGHRLRRAAAGGGRRARRRRDGGDHAAGHDPARPGVLRPELKGRWGAARLAADDAARR